MELLPSLNLDLVNTRRRERVAQQIETMRTSLAALELFTAHADAETLRGDYWADVVVDAEIAVKRALHAATHDGHFRKGWKD